MERMNCSKRNCHILHYFIANVNDSILLPLRSAMRTRRKKTKRKVVHIVAAKMNEGKMLKDLSIARSRQTNLHSMHSHCNWNRIIYLRLALSLSSTFHAIVRSISKTFQPDCEVWIIPLCDAAHNWPPNAIEPKRKRPNLQTNELDDNFVALCTLNVIGTKCPPNSHIPLNSWIMSNLIFVRALRRHDATIHQFLSLWSRRCATQYVHSHNGISFSAIHLDQD